MGGHERNAVLCLRDDTPHVDHSLTVNTLDENMVLAKVYVVIGQRVDVVELPKARGWVFVRDFVGPCLK